MPQQVTDGSGPATGVRTFLIADIRGYTRFTRERGDAAAATLAKRFADLARDAVEARSGRVIELRGDEALAVFESPAQAVRAALEFQATCAEESEADPAFLLPVGIGIDVGEAVPVEDGYRGVALNMAARLCSGAAAGQVLVTRGIVGSAAPVDGEIRFEERGPAEFKGFEQAVDVMEAVAEAATKRSAEPEGVGERGRGIPPELDPLTPLVNREHEMRWLRGTWRQVQRGRGRVLFVSGPAQIGKTRLAGEVSAHVHERGGLVRYAGPGGAATAMALSAIREAIGDRAPTLLVLDDVDVAGASLAAELLASLDKLSETPVLTLALIRDPASSPELSAAVERTDVRGDGHRVLAPLDIDDVREIVHLYAGEDTAEVPVESMARASQGIPGRVHEVVSDWARSEASRRLAAAADFLAQGRDRHASDLEFANNVIGLKLGRLYSVEGRDVLVPETCPYKGLAQFEEDDSAYFFGRERLVGELAARTVQVGLLGVVGASGSGKSSVVAAGLLPSLRAGLLPGSDRWERATLRPGKHPLAELRSALQRSLGPEVTTLEEAAEAVGPDGRLVLVVDQFEELFSLCEDEEERSTFIGRLSAAATGAPERAVIVVVVRDDFYGRSAPYVRFAELLAANHVLVAPMTRDELRRAIELPARRAGLRVESALVDALLEEVAEEPGSLPLLSTALVELWQAGSDGWIRLEAHERTGGVRGAVARLAEESFSRLEGRQREAARSVLLRLAGEGEGDAVTRRRVPIAEFDFESSPAAAAVLARFTEDRLLTASEGLVEVAHEALLREWPRLRDWLAEDVQGRQLRAHLTEASKQWEASGREPGELYRGARLSATLEWATLHGRELNELEREFLGAAREASEKETLSQRRTNRRLRGLLIGTAVFLVLALVAGALAFVQRSHARHSATVALSQSLGAQAVSETQLDTSLLLGLEGVRLDDSLQTRSDLLKALLHSPQAIGVMHVGRVATPPQAIALSPDGRTLAVLNGNGELWFYSTATRRPIGAPIHDVPWNFLWGPQFTPDGSQLVVQRGPGVEVIDVRTHRVVRTVNIGQDPGAVTSPVMLSPDGRVVYLQLGSVVQSWDMSTGRPLARAEVPGLGLQMVAVAGHSGQVVDLTTEGGGRVQIRDGNTLAVERSFRVPLPDRSMFASYALAVSPDGRTAVYGTNSGSDISLRFVDLRSGQVTVGSGGQAGGGLVAVSPNGRTAVSVDVDHRDISVWDVPSATLVETLSGHSGLIRGVAFSRSGRTLYSAGLDGNVFAWDLSGARAFARSVTTGPGSFTRPEIGHPYTYFSASSDGSIAVAYAPEQFPSTGSSRGGDVNIIDVATGRVITRVRVAGRVPGISSVSYAELSPDGMQLLVSPGPLSNGDITLWQVRPGPPSLLHTFSGLTATFRFDHSGNGFWNAPWATLSPDGEWIVGVDRGANGTGRMIEWSVDTGAERAAPLHLTWKPTDGPVSENVVYSPDGSLIATSVMGDRIALVDARTLKLVRTIQDPHGVSFVAFSPTNGNILAETSSDVGLVRLLDVRTGRQIAETTASNLAGLWSEAFDPSGQMLMTTGLDGVARLWSVPDLHQIGTDLPGRQNFHGVAAFAGRGSATTAVIVYGDRAFVYPASLQAWERKACLVAGRNFTKAEWAQYLGSRAYQTVCPGYPAG